MATEFQPYSPSTPAPPGYYFRRSKYDRVRDLLDARDLLCTAMFEAIGSGEGFDIAWSAMKRIDARIKAEEVAHG